MKIRYINNRDIGKFIFRKEIKKILFIGDTDTGKTTLLKEIAKTLIFQKIPVSIVDCDIGQSFIGPPTTISFIKLKKRVYNFFPFPEKFYFTGVISPADNIVSFLGGIEKMNKICEKRNNGKILIDTTGYIKDKFAIEIKIHKIEIFSPDLIILLEKKDELFPIKKFLKSSRIKFFGIKVPENFPKKTMEMRRKNRKEKLKRYFKKREKLELNISGISIKKISLNGKFPTTDFNGLMVSLRDKNFEDRVIGIVSKREGEFFQIIFPAGKVNFEIKGICLSNFRVI